MRVISPDEYRAAAGFRRSEAPKRAVGGVAPALQAYTTYSLDDPALRTFLRGGAESVAGVSVNERMALRNSVFFRATSLISGAMGMLPVHLYRRTGGDKVEKAKDRQLYKVLHRKPNEYQTPVEFKSFMQLAALLDGNAYARIVRAGREIVGLVPFPRRRVKPKLSDNFRLTFEYQPVNGGTVTLPASDVFHFRSPMSLDGLCGVSLLDIAADTLGLSWQAQRAAGRLMTKGIMAGGALETDDQLGADAIALLKASLAEQYAGSDAAGDWMVLEEGLKAKPFSGSAKDAQLTELRKQEAEEMARFTGTPRPLLMFDETAWGTGIEQLGLFFVTYCLMVWFVIWEEAIWRMLPAVDQETMYAKFNEGALLRGSLKDQAEWLSKALGAGGGHGWFTQNEARERFEMNPLAGGDELPRPGTTAAAVAEDDRDDDAS